MILVNMYTCTYLINLINLIAICYFCLCLSRIKSIISYVFHSVPHCQHWDLFQKMQAKMISKSLILTTLIISFGNSGKADPLAKTVINDMLKIIVDHVEWDNWEAWYNIMQEVRLSKNRAIISNFTLSFYFHVLVFH